MRVYKNVGGEVISVVDYTTDIVKKHPNVEIHIGTDSQNIRVSKNREERKQTRGRKKKVSKYAIVIAFRYSTRGVHYIYTTDSFPRIKDRYARLYKEAVLTIEEAEWFSNKMPSIKTQLDFDFNEDEKYFSQRLVDISKGWATGLGYEVNMKPNNQIATKAADKHCK